VWLVAVKSDVRKLEAIDVAHLRVDAATYIEISSKPLGSFMRTYRQYLTTHRRHIKDINLLG
jgi:hypothetical protein